MTHNDADDWSNVKIRHNIILQQLNLPLIHNDNSALTYNSLLKNLPKESNTINIHYYKIIKFIKFCPQFEPPAS